MAAPSPADWFSVVPVGEGVHALCEPGHVNSFLITGRNRALLFDTGLGLADIGAVTATLTNLPVTVVNSHSHLDHRGGNQHFDTVLAHRAAAPGLAESFSGAISGAWFGNYAARVHAAHQASLADDREYFHREDAALQPRPAPSADQLADWRVPPCTPTGELADGDTIDLGGRQLQVLHCPGHTPDSVVLFERDTGLLLAGDVLVAGVSYAHLDGADPDIFGATISQLSDRVRPDLTRILLAHTMRYDHAPDFLDEVRQGWQSVRDPNRTWNPWNDMFGQPCMRTDFRRFSITLPAPDEDPGRPQAPASTP